MEPDAFTDLVTTFHGQVPFVATPWRDLPGCGACVPCPACEPNPTDLLLTYRYWVPGTGQRPGYYSHTAEMRLCGVCASWEIRQLIRPDAPRIAEICSVEILMIDNGEGG